MATAAAAAVGGGGPGGAGMGGGGGDRNGDGVLGPPAGKWRPTSKRDLQKYETLLKRSVPLKPFTVLAEEAIPPVPEVERASRTTGTWMAFAPGPRQVIDPEDEEEALAEQAHRRAVYEKAVAPPPRDRTLNGFMLLEASSAALPHQATRVSLPDSDFVDVVAEDLLFFNSLMFVDLGDNQLSLEKLTPLRSVVELKLHCNGVREIGDLSGSYPKLEVLDLSYNAIDADSIQALSVLPALKELDLTCNGIETLPNSMAAFRKLEVLILERNRLEGDADLTSLSKAPRLRELNLSFNYFKRIPEAAAMGTGFRMLEWLSLANNYIASERDILPLVRFPRLLQVILYGNPITESQQGRAATAEAEPTVGRNAALNAEETDGKIVNLVTDTPAIRTGPKGAYNNFRITKVTDRTVPSANVWREAGNKLLFGEDEDEDLGASQHKKSKKKKKRKNKKNRPSRDDEKTNVFLTAAEDDTGLSVDSSDEDSDGSDAESISVPAALLQRSLEGHSTEPADPTKLRAAINALRHALKHPLTSHASKSARLPIERSTKLQKLRQKPIKPYKGFSGSARGGGGGVAGLNVAKHHVRGVGGTGELGATTALLPSLTAGRGSGGGAGAGAGAGASDGVDEDGVPAGNLERMEQLLETMDQRMVGVEDELGAASHHDRSMGLLMDMVGKVMQTYD